MSRSHFTCTCSQSLACFFLLSSSDFNLAINPLLESSEYPSAFPIDLVVCSISAFDFVNLPCRRSAKLCDDLLLYLKPRKEKEEKELIMQTRRRVKLSRVHGMVLLCSILLIWFPEFIAAEIVTLDSIEIFNTHELLNFKPTVYFRCTGENMTVLPDVKEKNVVYNFKGEESWQPLTELMDKKCKRCGIYERDSIKSDDIFDEWEFCASDFTRSDGKYNRFKEGEFNVTFLCPECVPLGNASEHSSGSYNHEKGMHWALVGLICALVSVVIILGTVAAYKYWQKRKKQQEQARFLQMFEDNDEIEDELGIGPLSHVI